jgi:hypothetical protein
LAGYEGLRAIAGRIMQACKQAASGMNPDKFPAGYTRRDLDAAYQRWEAWKRSMWPQLPEVEQEKITAALGKFDKANAAFDAELAKWAKRKADAQAADADESTGELPEYEPAEHAA